MEQMAAGAVRAAATPARLKARIVIPVWGAKYVERMASLCLPALLAPGNLPHLAEHFDCELTIVTQQGLFEMVRGLDTVKEAQRHCALRLVSMDDVFSHHRNYGYTITHALYRGFTDLGEAAKDAWFLFLNADFILADGSYRELVRRMLAGDRIIFAPSYCAIEERVHGALKGFAGAGTHALAVPPREMAGLILDNRHFTVRAKIVNWKMYRIDRVDQFYYVVDNDTMLGRQIPIAVVAFRPTRVPREPVTFWDYGIVSEVCPGCPLSVIGDSDQFLMMELRGERTMAEQFEFGWMDEDAVARDLSIWTTKDQRDCGEFPLVLHRRDLPAGTADGLRALDVYYRDVMRKVVPQPLDHRNHYIWRDVLVLHEEWLRRRDWTEAMTAETDEPNAARLGGAWRVLELVRSVYRRLFGRVPVVGFMHPQWIDLHPLVNAIRARSGDVGRALSITSKGGGIVSTRLGQWFGKVDHMKFAEVFDDRALAAVMARGAYDFCFVELILEELAEFRRAHLRLRGLVRKGGTILVFCRRGPGEGPVAPRDFDIIAGGLPSCDVAELRFNGDRAIGALQAIWQARTEQIGRGRVSALLGMAIVGAVVGPLSALANWFAARRDAGRYRKGCTSLMLEIGVL